MAGNKKKKQSKSNQQQQKYQPKQSQNGNANNTVRRKPAPHRQVSNSSGYNSAAADYLRTVLAPCSGSARIPDFNCMPTTLVTLTYEGMSSTNANGVGGATILINNVANIYPENLATTTDGIFTYLTAVPMPGLATFQAAYSYARVVSACVDITYVGNSLTDSGVIVGWQVGSFSGSSEAVPTSLNAAQSCRANQTNPAKQGMSVFYRPSDGSSFDFHGSASGPKYGELGFHITGGGATVPFYIRVTVNFEAIPMLDTGVITDTGHASPVDPSGHATAVGVTSKLKPFLTAENARVATDTMRVVKRAMPAVVAAAKKLFGKHEDL